MTSPKSIPVALSVMMGPHPVPPPMLGHPTTAHPGPLLTVAAIEGAEPIILLGANGAGKSRFAAAVAGAQGYVFIPADRRTTLPAELQDSPGPMGADLERSQQGRGQRERATQDVHALFSILKREEQDAASAYLRDSELDPEVSRPAPRLQKIEKLWQIIFPDREFSFRTRAPKVRWIHPDKAGPDYSASEMSDGEKSVLYLAARVIFAPPGVVIVDEPEVHLHSMLARRFWDEVERSRPECRFVYATHDLAFALSRRAPRIAIVRSPVEAALISKDSRIPGEIFEEIFGAASLSVVASRIVFCEGVDDGSIDRRFYEAWFTQPDTAVVPVGSCGAVRQATEVFKTNPAVAGAQALGIVERDYWPDIWLQSRKDEGLWVLEGHELESLFCLKAVAAAVASHLMLSDFEARWTDMEVSVRSKLFRESHIVERAKRRVDVALDGLANAARTNPDRAIARQSFIGAVDLATRVPDPGVWFDEEVARVDAAAAGSWDDVLRVFDGKKIIGLVATALGQSKEAYERLIVEGLRAAPDAPLGAALGSALAAHLPARKV